MERTYTHTIITMDGEEKEITLNRLTMRHGLKLQGMNEDAAVEAMLDLIAPDVLDYISPESLLGLIEVVMEVERGFFDQMTKMRAKLQKPQKKTGKSKQTK